MNGTLRIGYGRSGKEGQGFPAAELHAFAPDGRTLLLPSEVFESLREEGRAKRYRFALTPAEGPPRLFPGHVDNSVQFASWSPDGRKIAVLEWGQLVVLEVETGKVHRLGPYSRTAPEIWSYVKASWHPWSPDGERLAFVRDGEVWTACFDGTNARQHTFDGLRKYNPTFSRDGVWLAYLTGVLNQRRHYDRLSDSALWVLHLETGLSCRLTPPAEGTILVADWHPDGRLVFDRVQEAEPFFTGTLWTVRFR